MMSTKKSPWSKGFGIVSSEQHLMKAMNHTKKTDAYKWSVPMTDAEISGLYMPQAKRIIKGKDES